MNKSKINAMENNILTLLIDNSKREKIAGLYLPCGIEDLRRKMAHPIYADRMPLKIDTIAHSSVRPLIKSAIESLERKGMIETRKNGNRYELILLTI